MSNHFGDDNMPKVIICPAELYLEQRGKEWVKKGKGRGRSIRNISSSSEVSFLFSEDASHKTLALHRNRKAVAKMTVAELKKHVEDALADF